MLKYSHARGGIRRGPPRAAKKSPPLSGRHPGKDGGVRMLRQKLFGNGVEPTCGYCCFGSFASDGAAILCEKKGVVSPYYSCRKFRYDPLKRVPKRFPELQPHDPSEFIL